MAPTRGPTRLMSTAGCWAGSAGESAAKQTTKRIAVASRLLDIATTIFLCVLCEWALHVDSIRLERGGAAAVKLGDMTRVRVSPSTDLKSHKARLALRNFAFALGQFWNGYLHSPPGC